MRQHHDSVVVRTRPRSLHDISAQVAAAVTRSGIAEGACTLLILHTSASLLIQENADPDVQADLQDFLLRLCPEAPDRYRHGAEGPDDMPAHLRAALLPVSLQVPVQAGRLRLGAWQGIFVAEHRARPHERTVAIHVFGM